MRLFMLATSLLACSALPVLADEPPKPDQNQQITLIIAGQREQALNAVAICQASTQAVQAQLTEANAKIEELTKELAIAKSSKPVTP